MYGKIKEHLQNELEEIKENGLFKRERIITSPQDAEITISTGQKVINFCANNYLGLSSHKAVIQAAKMRWTLMDLECHPFVLFVVHRTSIKSWSEKLQNSMAPKIPYFTLLVSTLTEEYLSRCLAKRMPLSQIL